MTPPPDEVAEALDSVIKRDNSYPLSLEEFQALKNARAALNAHCEHWIKTTDRLPEKPNKKSYEYVDCLIYHEGEIKMRPWNCEHLCWDDEYYDAHFCDPLEPTHWMPLPPPPTSERAK